MNLNELKKIYGSLIPIANSNRKAAAKTNTFPISPIIKRISRLVNNQENIANKIPIIDNMQKVLIIK